MRDNGAIEGGAGGFSVDDLVIVLKKYDDSKIYVIAHADGIQACGELLVYIEAYESEGHPTFGRWVMVWDPIKKQIKADVPLNTSTKDNPQYAVFPCLAADISIWKAKQSYPTVSGDVIDLLVAGGSWVPVEVNPIWYYWEGYEGYPGHGEEHGTRASDPAGLSMEDATDWTGDNIGNGKDPGDPGGAVYDLTIDYSYLVNGCRGNQGLQDIWSGLSPYDGITATGRINPYFEIGGGSPAIYWDKEAQAGHIRNTGYYIELGYHGSHRKSDNLHTEIIIDSFNGPWGKIFDDIAVSDNSDEYHSQDDDPSAWGTFPPYHVKSGQKTVIYRQSLRTFNVYHYGGQQRSACYSKRYMLHLEYLEYVVVTEVTVYSLDNPSGTTTYERGDVRVRVGSTLCKDTSKEDPLAMERDIPFETAVKDFIDALEAKATGQWYVSEMMFGGLSITIMGAHGD